MTLVYKQFDEFWAKFTTERAAARRRVSDQALLELINNASEGFIWLKTFLAQVHIARTIPDSKQHHPRHLVLSGTYKSIWCEFCEIERFFTEEIYDLFAVHEGKEFVSFAGVAGRCYLVVIRDLALKHIMILQSHSIQGQLMPSCESFGLWENDWRCVSDQTVERFSPDRFEAVNRAFDEIEDFNYAFLLATKNRPLP